MTYSLRHPPQRLTGWPRLIWPLVYWQLIALKLWVRRNYGRGVPYWYEISPLGTVSLLRMPMDLTRSDAAPGALRPLSFGFTIGLGPLNLERLYACLETPRAPASVFGSASTCSVYVPFYPAHPDTS